MGLPILTSITGGGTKSREKNTTFIYKQDDFLSLVKILENLTTNKQKFFRWLVRFLYLMKVSRLRKYVACLWKIIK